MIGTLRPSWWRFLSTVRSSSWGCPGGGDSAGIVNRAMSLGRVRYCAGGSSSIALVVVVIIETSLSSREGVVVVGVVFFNSANEDAHLDDTACQQTAPLGSQAVYPAEVAIVVEIGSPRAYESSGGVSPARRYHCRCRCAVVLVAMVLSLSSCGGVVVVIGFFRQLTRTPGFLRAIFSEVVKSNSCPDSQRRTCNLERRISCWASGTSRKMTRE
ncbi:hypothetical protein BDZ89DRAFT_1042391 [Hymenopellis radicata]|nr:hypothetical protein BDZ89DRAFT_1042391 [Hymenopellis radicata]